MSAFGNRKTEMCDVGHIELKSTLLIKAVKYLRTNLKPSIMYEFVEFPSDLSLIEHFSMRRR